jgi:hypothetical protein
VSWAELLADFTEDGDDVKLAALQHRITELTERVRALQGDYRVFTDKFEAESRKRRAERAAEETSRPWYTRLWDWGEKCCSGLAVASICVLAVGAVVGVCFLGGGAAMLSALVLNAADVAAASKALAAAGDSKWLSADDRECVSIQLRNVQDGLCGLEAELCNFHDVVTTLPSDAKRARDYLASLCDRIMSSCGNLKTLCAEQKVMMMTTRRK